MVGIVGDTFGLFALARDAHEVAGDVDREVLGEYTCDESLDDDLAWRLIDVDGELADLFILGGMGELVLVFVVDGVHVFFVGRSDDFLFGFFDDDVLVSIVKAKVAC